MQTNEYTSQPRQGFFDRRFWAGAGIGCLIPVSLAVGLMVWASHVAESMMGELENTAVPNSAKVSYEWDFVSLDGAKLEVGELQGKVLFVNIWATWCAPCVAELPSIAQLESQVGDEVVFLCVSAEDLPTLRGFAEREGSPDVPIYSAVSAMPGELESPAIPATFVIDRRGRVRLQHVGRANWATSRCVNFLQELVQEDA